MNVSDSTHEHVRQISKRIWRFDASSNDAVGNRDPSMEEVDAYLPAVFTGAESAYFGAPETLFVVDERAVSREREFGNEPFQIMTGGIHGCMVGALLSNASFSVG